MHPPPHPPNTLNPKISRFVNIERMKSVTVSYTVVYFVLRFVFIISFLSDEVTKDHFSFNSQVTRALKLCMSLHVSGFVA